MFNLNHISKVILVAGAFAFASFCSPSASAQADTKTFDQQLQAPSFSAPVPNPAQPDTKTINQEIQGKFKRPFQNPLQAPSFPAPTQPDTEILNQQLQIQVKGPVYGSGNVQDQINDASNHRNKIVYKDEKKPALDVNDYLPSQAQLDEEEEEDIKNNKSTYLYEDSDNVKKLYQDARLAYDNAQAKFLAARQECLTDPAAAVCSQLDELEKDIAVQKKNADNAYLAYQTAQQNLADNRKAVDDAQAALSSAEDEVQSLTVKLDEATKACDYSKKLTSKAGQADAQRYCSEAADLQKKLAAAEEKVKQAQDDLNQKRTDRDVEHGLDPHDGMEFRAFATTAEYTGKEENIFNTMTRRAFTFLVDLKPLIYVLAGFGLIAFAYMAIFNKISWKWFSNIAIGLFLVANMGRFIEYFVFPTGSDGAAPQGKLSYGDNLSKGFADAEYKWVEATAAYVPPSAVEGETPQDTAAEEKKCTKATSSFCGNTSYERDADGCITKSSTLSGWGSFTNCIKDITTTAKKAVDTAKTAQKTVKSVKSGVKSVKYAAENIGNAISNAKGNGLSGIIKAAGQIGSNVNHMIGVTGGVVNGVLTSTGDIANNVQDLGKSNDAISQLENKRGKGEATNEINRLLTGQTVGADGEIERLYGGLDQNGNVVEGKIATDSNVLTDIKDTTQEVIEKSQESNTLLQGLTSQGYQGAKILEDVTGVTGKLQKKKQQKAEKEAADRRAAAEAEYKARQTAAETERKTREAALEEERRKEAEIAEAERLRQQYAAEKNKTPPQKAQDSVTKANKAINDAKTAETDARIKKTQADRAKEEARVATIKATKSGDPVDKLAAEQARKRAQIADDEARRAAVVATKAWEPVAQLEREALENSIEETKYTQKQAKEEAASASVAIKEAQTKAREKALEAQKAQEEAERLAQLAITSNKNEDILAANEAVQLYRQKQREAQEAQTEIDKQIKRRNDAEMTYYEAATLQAEYESGKRKPTTYNPYYTGGMTSTEPGTNPEPGQGGTDNPSTEPGANPEPGQGGTDNPSTEPGTNPEPGQNGSNLPLV